MPRYIKQTIAYDPRSGWKVPYQDMVEDGENPGLIVAEDMADELNMQRYPAKFFPEGVLRKAFPPNERDDVTFSVGQIWSGEPDFAYILTPTALGGSTSFAQLEITRSEVVTYLGENITYMGEPVIYTEVVP